MKKDVVLIANYWHFEEEKSSSRYRSFADILCKEFDMEVITSTFCHLKKAQRNEAELHLDTLPYRMKLCYEQGYSKNISIRRIRSYTKFGKNVLAYLRSRKKPDLIMVSVPSLAVADYASKYAKENCIPLIVDIQDLWPEAFKMALNIPVVSDILFSPMMRQANRIYSRADVLMAVSDTYVARGKRVNPTADTLSIYIGTDSSLVEEKTKGIDIPAEENKFVVGYVGALGHSYDIKGVIDAIRLLKDEGCGDIKFTIMGDGVCRADFEEYAQKSGIDYEFTGLLEYGRMMKTLMACDVAVNPIVGRSVSSIINKVSDYAAAGVPVINTQNSKEYRDLLVRYEAGINVESGNVRELADAILTYHDDAEYRAKCGAKEKKMYSELFDRVRIYPKLVQKMRELMDGSAANG